jgi:hypothetical protein
MFFSQKCGPLRAAVSEQFLKELQTNFYDVQDERVAQGISSMLGRNILILSSSSDGVTLHRYRPYSINHLRNSCVSTLVLGHIKDYHFIPLKPILKVTGNLILSTVRLLFFVTLTVQQFFL